MGCTSSAPNTFSANANKEDKNIQLQEGSEESYSKKNVETIHTESENRTKIKVLPSSDTTEPVQLVRSYKSSTNLEPEKDFNTNGHIVESESSDTSETRNVSKEEENNDKISKLKLEVLGNFIEISQHNTDNDKDVKDSNTNEAAICTEINNEETDATMESESNETYEECENSSEETEDATASPSQSQSSRATRWEALADIAAELPPSLAVDTITGQIYSLSK